MTKIQVVAALGFVAAVLGILGNFDYADAISTEADEKVARAAAIAAASDAVLSLTHPIPYKAVLCQSGPGEKPTCRYYVERTK